MRMRNKPWANDFLNAHPKVIQDPSLLKGKWKKEFNLKRIVLEIGSGKGDYWRKMAELQPDTLWIALERDKNVSAIALKKECPNNAVWIVGDAEDLEKWFDLKEIDTIHLNFSDPWPKKRYHKRRLTSNLFIERMLNITSDEAEFKFKTDNKDLFEYTMLVWEDYPLKLVEFSVDFRRKEENDDAITEYEQHFMDLNQVIYRAVWRKKDVK